MPSDGNTDGEQDHGQPDQKVLNFAAHAFFSDWKLTIRARWSCVGTWEVYDATDAYWRAACPTLYADLGPLDVPSCRCAKRIVIDSVAGMPDHVHEIELRDSTCWYHGDPAARRRALVE